MRAVEARIPKASLCLTLGVFCLLVNVSQGQSTTLNQPCQSDVDCRVESETCSKQELSSEFEDSTSPGDISSVCVHKDQFPMFLHEFLFYFILLVIQGLSNAAGSGGGGIVIPIALSLFGFNTKTSIALSNCCLAFSGVVRFLKSIKDSHPLKNGKGVVYDYNFAAVSLPAAIVGASFGSIVNIVAPEPVVLALFLCVTLYTAWSSLKNYCQLRKTERSILHDNSDVAAISPQQAEVICQPKVQLSKGEPTKDIEATIIHQVQVTLQHCKSMPVGQSTTRMAIAKQTSAVSGLSSGSSSSEHDESSSSSRPFSPGCIIIADDVVEDFEAQSHGSSVYGSPFSKVTPQPPSGSFNKQATLDPFARSGTSITQATISAKSVVHVPKSNNASIREALVESENSNWQPKKQFTLIVMLIALIAVSLLRGSGKEPSIIGSERCSPTDWTLQAVLVTVGFFIIALTFFFQLREMRLKQRVGYRFVKGDLKFTPKTLLSQTAINFAVGFVNSLAGVGPGVVLMVLMMKLNMHPMVAERTANLVAAVITCASSICAVYYGELPVDYAACFGLISVIATAYGMKLRDWILNKSGGSYSILVLLLFLMILTTFVSTSTLNLIAITGKVQAGEPVLVFKSYC